MSPASEALMADLVDGAASTAQRAGLAEAAAADPALRAELAAQLRLDHQLRLLLAPVDSRHSADLILRAIAGESPSARRRLLRRIRGRTRLRWIPWAAAAAALLACLAGAWLAFPRAPRPLAVGAPVALADGSRVELAPGGAASLIAEGRLALTAGTLHAEIRPRPLDRPFRIATPHGEATVVGTRFSLAVAGERTTLSVESGRVRLAGAVGALEAAAGTQAELGSSGAPRSLLRFGFGPGQDPRWNGRAVATPPAGAGAPVLGALRLRAEWPAVGIVLGDFGPHGLCRLGPDAAIRLRLWVAAGLDDVRLQFGTVVHSHPVPLDPPRGRWLDITQPMTGSADLPAVGEVLQEITLFTDATAGADIGEVIFLERVELLGVDDPTPAPSP